MKFLYRIGLICTLVLAVYFCFRFVEVFYPGQQIKLEMKHTNEEITESDNYSAVEATVVGDTLTCDTEYIIKEYDKTTRTEETLSEMIPDQFIGKTREQIEEIVDSYSQAPSLEDLEKGFASMEVVSFSPQKLIVLKKYFSDMTKEHFYLVVEDEYITVYYSDLQSVYLYTDIYVPNLPQQLQQEILDKKYMESEEELYNFLESYSS